MPPTQSTARARTFGRLGGTSGRRSIFLVIIAAGILSALLNNTPVVIIFIPILTVVAAQRRYAGFRVFMPLSFMCILGGMTTLLGSSTNLIAASVAEDNGVVISFFDLTGMGVILAAVGGIYVLFIMPSMMRERSSDMARDHSTQGAQFIGEIPIVPGRPFVGFKSRAGMFPGIRDLTLRLMHRRDVPILPPFEDITLSAGDTLVVTGTRRAFSRALAHGSAVAEPDEPADGSETQDDGPGSSRPGPDYHLVEAVIAPGSRFAGRTIQLSGIRARYGVSVFGVQRKSRMARMPLSEIRLEPGDTLLLGGNYDQLMQMRGDHDLLLLEYSAEPVPQTRKAMIAFSIFLMIIVFSAFEILPIAVRAITGAALMLAFGCLTIYQAARAFDHQVFPAGGILDRAGDRHGADGRAPVEVVLSLLFIVMACVTNALSNNATVVLFMPIALGIAARLGASQETFVSAVTFAANTSFATPIGYQTNLLVMGPGHLVFAIFCAPVFRWP